MSRTIASLVAGLFLAGLVGCGNGPPKGGEAALPRVEVARVITRSVRAYENFTGRTEAKRSIDIRARVTGYLDKVMFKEGDDVKEGTPLFEIDPRPYQATLNGADANLAQANAHLKRLNNDYERAVVLLGKQAMSQEDFDRIVGDRGEAVAAVGVAKAQVESARLNLGFTKISAPITGRISRQNIDPGNLVQADNTVLTTIVSLDPIYVYFDVDERTMLRLRRLVQEGKIKSAREQGVTIPVEIGTSDEDGFPHPGVINFVDNRVDPATGTLRVRAEAPNPKAFLSPGLFARLRIPIGDPHPATVVAERALGTDQGQKFLFVVGDDDVVQYRPVTIGALQNGLREIVDGVKEGERVVVSGLQRVRKGVKVDAGEVDMEKLPNGTKMAVASNNGAATK
jgi:RND family efflux transporter MFP subunit